MYKLWWKLVYRFPRFILTRLCPQKWGLRLTEESGSDVSGDLVAITNPRGRFIFYCEQGRFFFKEKKTL